MTPTLNRNVLQSLANRTGGRYHDIQLADSDLAFLLSNFDLLDDDELKEVDEEFDIWYESGPWLLLLVLPVAAMSFRKGRLLSLVLLSTTGVLLPSNHAQAFDWRDLGRQKTSKLPKHLPTKSMSWQPPYSNLLSGQGPPTIGLKTMNPHSRLQRHKYA